MITRSELALLWHRFRHDVARQKKRIVLLVSAIAYPLLYLPSLQTEFHLLPVLVAGFGATSSSSRVRSLVAAAVTAIDQLSPDLAPDRQVVGIRDLVFRYEPRPQRAERVGAFVAARVR